MNSKASRRHPSVPAFSAEILEAVASALGRRAKAIKYHNSTFNCTRELVEGIERLNVDVDALDFTTVRLSVWESGELWLGVHRRALGSNAGWELAFTGSGVAHAIEPARIVSMLEETLANRYAPDSLVAIWQDAELTQDA